MPTLTAEEQKALAQRFSPERLAALRARMQADAQRAVRDEAEQGFREPTAEEAAALAGPASDSAPAPRSPSPGGGVGAQGRRREPRVREGRTVGKDGAVVTHDGEGGAP